MNNREITWGIAGSLLLYFHNIVNNPNDIDIIVAEDDAVQINKVISTLGEEKKGVPLKTLSNKFFSKYCVDYVDIDIMGGFAIQHAKGIYKLPFNEESIVEHNRINGIDIPLCSLEDWFVLYLLIPNREDKVTMIEEYFNANGIDHPIILEKAIQQRLPDVVEKRVINLLDLVN